MKSIMAFYFKLWIATLMYGHLGHVPGSDVRSAPLLPGSCRWLDFYRAVALRGIILKIDLLVYIEGHWHLRRLNHGAYSDLVMTHPSRRSYLILTAHWALVTFALQRTLMVKVR